MNRTSELTPENKIKNQCQMKKLSWEKHLPNTDFLVMLVHGLRNPLMPVFNALEIWKSGNAGEKEQNDAQMIMDRQLQKINQLADDLLDVVNIMRGNFIIEEEIVDLLPVINFSIAKSRTYFESRKQEVSLSLPSRSIFVKGDAVRLKQAVFNLLVNSSKNTRSCGQISIILECESGTAFFRIIDNGNGISHELLPNIFDLFAQEMGSSDKKQCEPGLELTFAHNLIELQGGTVEAKSQGLGKGREFIVSMPVVSEEGTGVPLESSPIKDDLFVKRRILIIEDTADSAISTQNLLEQNGHTVHIVFDGAAGIKEAKMFRPEIILLDIGLPYMDGYEVAKRLRAEPETKNVMLIALSGYSQPEDIQKALDAGFDHHLAKPAGLDKIEAIIKLCKA